jgi:glucose-1-phosphate thymidylyltransferase
MSWKGLLMAGGSGSRLYPVTAATNKHLLPVFDKPLIYYALTTLMLAGIRQIVVVSTSSGVPSISALLGDGSQFGITLTYVTQPSPAGVAQGLVLAADELSGHNIAMILADNIFIGAGLEQILRTAMVQNRGATVFSYDVANPQFYGIVTFADAKPVDITEKPLNSESRTAVTGLYFYDLDAISIARELKPSARGELEITDVNRKYLRRGQLDVHNLGRGIAWLDGGSPDDLFQASQFVHVVESRTGLKIGAPEEIAYRNGYISRNELARVVANYPPSKYRDYLQVLLDST